MTDKLHDPKTQGPGGRHPGPYQADVNPNAAAGQNYGLIGPHPEKGEHRTERDVKEAYDLLGEGFTDDLLEQIPVLPEGSRLEQGATYIDLRDPARREFTATGGMSAGAGSLHVPKSEVDYQLWNRLIGVTDPARTGVRGGGPG
jgi:hypothetical protein